MPTYVRPKGVTQEDLDNALEVEFGPAHMLPSDEALESETCTRCAQRIAEDNGTSCDKGENRCDHCAQGRRGGCIIVSPTFRGRVAALYVLRERYRAQVASLGANDHDAIRANPEAFEAALNLARAQREYTAAWTSHCRVETRTGGVVKNPTKQPESTQDYLALLLGAERERNVLLTEGNRLTAVNGNHVADLIALLRPLLPNAPQAAPAAPAADNDEEEESDNGGAGGEGGEVSRI
ncbi:hypothetical protein LTR08_000922 [Meristemomyces frigidus]|nr:hypothetical protein LTR08_000922 [Meristemomyces frigidus]